MEGRAQPAQIAGLLIALAMKGERPSEVVGLARTMRATATKLSRDYRDVFDTCGTGGDRAHTFNVSTVAALVVAACGVRVAKHGNRSVSSRCGSADLFEALGVNIGAPAPVVVERCLDEAGIAFFFAPTFHPSMRHAGADAEGARRADRVQSARPADQSCGRLPAAGRRAATGADRARRAIARPARARRARGSCTAPTASTRSRRPATPRCRSTATAPSTRSTCTRPTWVSPRPRPKPCAAAMPPDNARIARDVLGGGTGAARDIVLLNAGASLLIAGAAQRHGARDSARAAAALDSDGPRPRLERLTDAVERDAGGGLDD